MGNGLCGGASPVNNNEYDDVVIRCTTGIYFKFKFFSSF